MLGRAHWLIFVCLSYRGGDAGAADAGAADAV